MTLAVLLNGDGRGDLRTVGARVSASRRGRDDDALVLRRYRSADHDAICYGVFLRDPDGHNVEAVHHGNRDSPARRAASRTG